MAKTRRRLLSVVLLVVVGVLVGAASPSGAKDVVYVNPFVAEYTIGPGQVAVLKVDWAACSKGLTQDFRDAEVSQYTLTKDGEIVQEIAPRRAAGIRRRPVISSDNPTWCAWPTAHSWITRFRVRLLTHEPGTYELHSLVTLTEPITDGQAYLGGVAWWEDVLFDKVTLIHVTE